MEQNREAEPAAEPEAIEGELVPESEHDTSKPTALAVQTSTSPVVISAAGAMLLPVEQQTAALAEYDARRECFHHWLLSKLKPGIHYGFPFPVKKNANGEMIVWNGKKKREEVIPKDQWQAKPSLYLAGALLICDLMNIHDEYKADLPLWQMFGSIQGMIVLRCELFSGQGKDAILLGSGHGAFEPGEKGMGKHSAILMAKKRALVNAVRSSVRAVGELFTQDMEDMRGKTTPAARETTERKADAAVVPSRDDRNGTTSGQVAKPAAEPNPEPAVDVVPIWPTWKRFAVAVHGKGFADSPKASPAFYCWMASIIGRTAMPADLSPDELAKLTADLTDVADPRPTEARPDPSESPL